MWCIWWCFISLIRRLSSINTIRNTFRSAAVFALQSIRCNCLSAFVVSFHKCSMFHTLGHYITSAYTSAFLAKNDEIFSSDKSVWSEEKPMATQSKRRLMKTVDRLILFDSPYTRDANEMGLFLAGIWFLSKVSNFSLTHTSSINNCLGGARAHGHTNQRYTFFLENESICHDCFGYYYDCLGSNMNLHGINVK